ncbi:MAG TPA: ECF-type sigma factor [Vicinamibacterales bacterium]|nr:ECF-type sigma factor [Vicinamibacterales bacterium]
MGSHAEDVTRLLQEWRSGRQDALERLMPLVYEELHVIASRHMAREWRVGALQTTALVSEAYLKLVGQRDVDWQSRAHFFAIAATMMRRILVDNARRDRRVRHGGGAMAVPLDDVPALPQPVTVDAVDALALDAALRKLEALDPEQARIVELRFFGGLTVEETAEVAGISPATVKREWALAKGWLYRELTGQADP